MSATRRWSRAAFRMLLRVYPASFQQQYGRDLETDFADLLAERGAMAAWRHVVADLFRSLRVSHGTAGAERRHVHRLTLGQLGGASMGTLMFDTRHAVRGLVRAPAFTLVTVGTLALGIGANSAIFSLVNAALLRPLGYRDAERVMVLYESFPERNTQQFGVAPSDFEDIVRHQRSFTDLGAYRLRAFELSGGDVSEEINVAQVTETVFQLLGVGPAQGRTLGPTDAGDPRVVVLSHGLWQRRFGGQDVLGAQIVLSRQPYTIIGVMPATFEFPKRGPQRNGEPADLWMPLVFTAGERQARGNFYNHTVLGRLREGITPEQAAADMKALSIAVREQYPVVLKESFASSLTITATPLIDDIVGQVRRPLIVLLAAVGLVLLVACANIANLVLSRAVSREREIGVRTALGAAPGRLFRMLVTESLVLGLLAGGLGLIVAQSVLRAMPAVIATSLPGVSNASLDRRVVGFALVLSLVTAVVFGLVPLVAGGGRSLSDVLRDGGAAIGGRRRHRLQGSLVVTSVALAFMLLVAAGLLTRSLTQLLAVDSGLQPENVLSMRVTLPFASYNNAAAVRGFYQNARDRIAAIPGVRTVSISTDLPLVNDGERRVFTADSMDTTDVSPTVAVTWVEDDYFATFGIPILTGRTFTSEEQRENRFAVIVSRGLAAQYWPGENAVGKRLRWGLAEVITENQVWMTVVGIAGDVLDGPPGAEHVPYSRYASHHIYVPYSEVADLTFMGPVLSGFYRALTIAVRSQGDVRLVAAPVRSAIAAIDPALAISDVRTMEEVASDASAPQRFSATMLAGFAVGALVLAAVGLYGVLAFGVAQRTREIGVRLALGANAGSVVGMVVRRGMLLTSAGLLLGAAGALASTRVISALLFQTPANDPATFVVVFGVLCLVSLVACYIPARRATRIDPLVALRTE